MPSRRKNVMSMHDSEWRDAKKDMNRAGRFGLSWFVIVVIVVGLVSAAVWTFSVFVSGPKGQGDALKEKNSADNWVQAQAEFNRLYQEIEADDRKITIAKQQLDENPADQVLSTNYNGLVNHCNGLVGDYNTLARSYLSEDFRDADLPEEIDSTNPNTDCKENLS